MRVSIKSISVKDILPNRYRKIESYKISETKLDALIQSYHNSGFWDGSLQARPHPTRAGKFEIAFGHHRIEAAKRFGLKEVGLVVSARTDSDMLRMMADENREEFKGDHLVAIETVAAVIEAFGKGEVELEPVPADTRKGYVFAGANRSTYTLASVARFLGWTMKDGQATNACRLAFEAFHHRANIVPALQRLPEEERTRTATAAVIQAVKTARTVAERGGKTEPEVKRAEAAAASETVKRIKSGEYASKLRDESKKVGRRAAQVTKELPTLPQYVFDEADRIYARFIDYKSSVNKGLSGIEQYSDELPDNVRAYIVESLKRCEREAANFHSNWANAFVCQPKTVGKRSPRALSAGEQA